MDFFAQIRMEDISFSILDNSNQSAVTESQQNCQSEVWSLFKNLSSWKEESQNQIVNIINSYDRSIKKSIGNLVQEVCGLKTQLSVTAKERNALMETVNGLNDEIRQLNAKLVIADRLSEPEDMEETTPFIEEVQNDTGNMPEVMWHQNKNHLRYQEENSELNEDFTGENVSTIEDEEQNKEEVELASNPEEIQAAVKGSQHPIIDTFKCDICQYKTNVFRHLQMHLAKAHLKDENKEFKTGNKKFKCDQCPYNGKDLKRHIKGVHDKIKDHICGRCGYAASRKHHLDSHKRGCQKTRRN